MWAACVAGMHERGESGIGATAVMIARGLITSARGERDRVTRAAGSRRQYVPSRGIIGGHGGSHRVTRRPDDRDRWRAGSRTMARAF